MTIFCKLGKSILRNCIFIADGKQYDKITILSNTAKESVLMIWSIRFLLSLLIGYDKEGKKVQEFINSKNFYTPHGVDIDSIMTHRGNLYLAEYDFGGFQDGTVYRLIWNPEKDWFRFAHLDPSRASERSRWLGVYQHKGDVKKPFLIFSHLFFLSTVSGRWKSIFAN